MAFSLNPVRTGPLSTTEAGEGGINHEIKRPSD